MLAVMWEALAACVEGGTTDWLCGESCCLDVLRWSGFHQVVGGMGCYNDRTMA